MTRDGALGAVAGGHPATAEAGAEIMRAGGNAADAAVAAVAASTCAEACLTGLGGGGFALVRTPDGAAELLDFFVAAPGRGRSPADLASRSRLEAYEVPFRSTTQVFHIGPASCAVPGVPSGLAQLHARHGRLPLAEVLAPAVRLARRGATVVDQQDYLHDILEGILTREPSMLALFAPEGHLVRSGELLRSPALADALETLGASGSEPFTHGAYAERIVAYLEDRGGSITMEDLAGYEVVVREPVRISYRGHEILTNPLPSSGGTLIAFTLGLLDTIDVGALDEVERTMVITAALEATDAARVAVFDGCRGELGFADSFLAPDHLDKYAARLGGTGTTGAGTATAATGEDTGGSATAGASQPHGPGGATPSRNPGNTTHVSAIDADGMAVSVTTSCGSGSGVIVEGTGIYLNNMMGEEDLNPGGFFTLAPGARLTSMMAPTIAWGRPSASCTRASGRPDAASERLIALGSAGSARLRSAIVQVLVNMLDLCADSQTAVDRPRKHVDGGTVHLEAGTSPEAEAHLRRSGRPVQAWSVRDLFFGGVQVVCREERPSGVVFDGGGDPRRGGTARLV